MKTTMSLKNMFKNLFTSALVSVIAMSLQLNTAFAAPEGTKDGGGGGDIIRSTNKEVMDYLLSRHNTYSGMKDGLSFESNIHYLILSLNYALNERMLKRFSDPILKLKVKTIYNRIMANAGWPEMAIPNIYLSESLIPNKPGVHIYIEENKACLHDGLEKMGSTKKVAGTTIRDEQWHICISAKKLQEVPEIDLPKQAVFLIFHEFAHIAGLSNEDEVVDIQTRVGNQLYSDCEILVYRSMNFNNQDRFASYSITDTGLILRATMSINLDLVGAGYSQGAISTRADMQSPFSLNWTPEKGGEMTFNELGFDGNFKIRTVKWGPMTLAKLPAYVTNTVNFDGDTTDPRRYIIIPKTCLIE